MTLIQKTIKKELSEALKPSPQRYYDVGAINQAFFGLFSVSEIFASFLESGEFSNRVQELLVDTELSGLLAEMLKAEGVRVHGEWPYTPGTRTTEVFRQKYGYRGPLVLGAEPKVHVCLMPAFLRWVRREVDVCFDLEEWFRSTPKLSKPTVKPNTDAQAYKDLHAAVTQLQQYLDTIEKIRLTRGGVIWTSLYGSITTSLWNITIQRLKKDWLAWDKYRYTDTRWWAYLPAEKQQVLTEVFLALQKEIQSLEPAEICESVQQVAQTVCRNFAWNNPTHVGLHGAAQLPN